MHGSIYIYYNLDLPISLAFSFCAMSPTLLLVTPGTLRHCCGPFCRCGSPGFSDTALGRERRQCCGDIHLDLLHFCWNSWNSTLILRVISLPLSKMTKIVAHYQGCFNIKKLRVVHELSLSLGVAFHKTLRNGIPGSKHPSWQSTSPVWPGFWPSTTCGQFVLKMRTSSQLFDGVPYRVFLKQKNHESLLFTFQVVLFHQKMDKNLKAIVLACKAFTILRCRRMLLE